jgi:WD40 repeat protein
VVVVVYCFNPSCPQPQNQPGETFCHSCGARLLLLDRYQGIQRLGQGQFGRTILAIDRSQTSPIPCVVKQLWGQGVNAQPQAKARFQQSVDRFNELSYHPQIPSLLNSFEQEGLLYVVQEYIEGESLTALLQQGNSGIQEVWQLLENLLPILQFMHSHGAIHGDIKPDNIIRANSSQITNHFVLVDVGGATLLTAPLLSQPATAIGSSAYAAPEQVKGNATFASDLYSLGVTCIHLLTGIHPFTLLDCSSNRWVWRDYWLQESVNSTAEREFLQLATILDRLIEPELNQRFSSAQDAIATIQKVRGKKIASSAFVPLRPHWECYTTLTGHSGLFAGINALALDSEGHLLASASDDRSIRLWDLQTRKQPLILRGHTQFAKSVAFHPHLKTILASGSRDRTIKIWDLQVQKEKYTLLGHNHGVNALTFNPDGTILASGSSDKNIKLWNSETGELITTLSGHRLAVNAIAISPARSSSPHGLLASGSSDSCIRIWNLLTFEPIQILSGHTAAVKAVAFSPDGKLLVTGGEDRTIRLWDSTSWECLYTMSGHPWSISALAFFPDGNQLLSGSWDKTMKLWQVDTGKEITTLKGHTDSVSCIAIAPDGSRIASGSQDRAIKLWKLHGTH